MTAISKKQKHIILMAVEDCNNQDKSPEYLFQYASDLSGAEYDDVVDYIVSEEIDEDLKEYHNNQSF